MPRSLPAGLSHESRHVCYKYSKVNSVIDSPYNLLALETSVDFARARRHVEQGRYAGSLQRSALKTDAPVDSENWTNNLPYLG